MSNRFLGTWKLVSSENFEDYMKALDYNNFRRSPESSPEMGRQRDYNKEKFGGWKNDGGMQDERSYLH
uniref:Peripheral myelin protein 2 n=1 Tax=Sarcophilus harrisii TaxID=9305 RepID=A0A7N4PSF4_SARHA